MRTLAQKAGGQISVSDFYGKQHQTIVQVYFGVSSSAVISSSEIVYLVSMVQPLLLPYNLTLTAGHGQYMYWVTLVELGPMQFYDRESMFIGGWDGAHGFPDVLTTGPRTIALNGLDYYLYRTDYMNLGRVPWQVQQQI